MTKSGATSKAKRYTGRLQNSSVITNGISYECVHTDYLNEYIEEGWSLVASYEYNEKCEVVKV